MLKLRRARCQALFSYDVALSIDLNEAERRITAAKQRETIKHKRRAPKYFQYHPPPLRVSLSGAAINTGSFRTSGTTDLVLYDFGAVSVNYEIPIQGSLSDVLQLGLELYDNAALLQDSRLRVERLVEMVPSAVLNPSISPIVEDYVIFQAEGLDPEYSIDQFLNENWRLLAQILRAEPRELSDDEMKDALSQRISFSSADITIVDWNAAILLDQEAEDSLAVLEFANVELMEMRHLDRRLDDALGLAYEMLNKRSWQRFPFGSDPARLHKVAQWQVDSAILFEGVNNALKLVGDQYLARLYRMTAGRFHLAEWDASIIRKLNTLESIYGKITDQVASRRMEVLEWIIIALIAISIALPFFVAYSGS